MKKNTKKLPKFEALILNYTSRMKFSEELELTHLRKEEGKHKNLLKFEICTGILKWKIVEQSESVTENSNICKMRHSMRHKLSRRV